MRINDIGGTPAAGGSSRGGETTAAGSPLPRRHARRNRRRLNRNGGRVEDAQIIADARLVQERRRFAADLHDLVMQDLSFALVIARSIAYDPTRAGEQAAAAAAAAERALSGARAIVGDLGERERQPIVGLLERSVREAARGTALVFQTSVERTIRADQPTAEALVHVAREAVTNGVKHGGARSISVTLSHEDEWILTVADDGHGFDPASTGSGFGLSSMSVQAEALGGSFALRSAIGAGTDVEVSLP